MYICVHIYINIYTHTQCVHVRHMTWLSVSATANMRKLKKITFGIELLLCSHCGFQALKLDCSTLSGNVFIC